MLKHIAALLLIVNGGARLSAQSPQAPHQWKTVLQQPGAQVELDTTALVAQGYQRRVWLRWTLPTGMPDYTDVQVEQREVDCNRLTTRILATQDVSVFDGRPSTSALVRRDSSAVWVQPDTGSLVGQVVKMICG